MVTFYPRTETFPGIEDTGLDDFIVRFRQESSWLFWLGIVCGTAIFHATPLLTVFLPVPAFVLPARLREKHAQRIVSSRIYLLAQAVFLLKLTAGLCWWPADRCFIVIV